MDTKVTRSRNLRGPIGIVAALAAAAAGCQSGEANEALSALTTATVERQTIVSSVEATGTIEPIRIIEVKSQAGGEILELPVELGDYVEQGTLLVRIDPRDVRNAFEQASADLEVAEARFDVATRQLERIRTLHDSDIVTDEELEGAILEHANAKAVLVRAQTNLELAEDRLNDVTLRAPISGTVVERTVEQGQVITGTRDLTGGTVLMRMADLNEVQVRTLVDETDIGRLEAGLGAEITVEAYPERRFNGNVLKIEPQAVVQQNVTMFAVLTRIANENDLLKPGMNADVEVVVGRESDVLALPNGAVKTPQEATQLAEALAIDADVQELQREMRQGGRGGPGAPGGNGEAEGELESAGEAEASEETIGGVPVSRLATMSQDERRRWFTNLSEADRQRAFQLFRRQREGQAQADRGDPSRPKPAFVFVADESGALSLKPIMIGLSDFDHTQVLRGLEEGDQVVTVPLSLVQQQDLLERIRSRSGVPGISRNGN
jgi:HlyD family secretion protein